MFSSAVHSTPSPDRCDPCDPFDLRPTLKQYFGYDTFRPGQAEIITQVLKGKDVFALMPTGGGKSLCYQLPALLMPGVTLVISPLIALMQDQVVSLQNNGIGATFLNSSLSQREQRHREQALVRGDYKLLYLAPERFSQEGFWPLIEQIQQQQGIPRMVVDEAHCISEWGHDFRPEYRQLRMVRERLADIPVTALTATATDRVRSDIVHQLALQDPFTFVASFDRPNLYYAVYPKSKRLDADVQLIQLIKSLESGAAIVYCQSRAEVERVAERLCLYQIQALPYHAGLAAEQRQDHQDRFIRDQVQVMVATIAFGMGINKPDVRLVIHYDLPRNIEGYYQESGRAGRDGLSASCILFFSRADRGKIEYLIEQKSDPQEQRIARQQLRQMLDYAETHLCRRRIILGYFSETPDQENCGNCDNCCQPVQLEDRTIEAQKFLSCVYRCQQRFGMKHIIDVLRGSKNQRIQQLGHDRLSTYGIGHDLTARAWQHLGRSLLQQGFLNESQDGYPVLSISDQGWQVLKRQVTVEVPQLESKAVESKTPEPTSDPTSAAPTAQNADQADPNLVQHLRQLRRQLADTQSVPPYVVFPDRTLLEMAQVQPTTLDQMQQIHGVGSRKLAQYGQTFLDAIQQYHLTTRAADQPDDLPDDLENAESSDSTEDASPPPLDQTHRSEVSNVSDLSTPSLDRHAPELNAPEASLRTINPTQAKTLSLYQQGLSVDAIAKQRQLSRGTIISHLAQLLAEGAPLDLDELVSPARQRQIFRSFYDLHSYASLSAVRELLGEEFSYEEIRLVRAAIFQQP